MAGHELVRYGRAHAQAQARQVRHSFQEYEYAIHRISHIDDGTGQIYIAHDARYTSAQLLPETAALYIKTEQPRGSGVVKSWFKDPGLVLLTAIVPPYGLTMLGLAAAGDHMHKREQEKRRRALSRYLDAPKFVTRHRA